MSIPDRPAQVDQLDGSRYAGLNCNCAAAAMALDRHTLGEHRTTCVGSRHADLEQVIDRYARHAPRP